MIISISGKKGSGKDLVGKIIQYWFYADPNLFHKGFFYYPPEEFIKEYLENNQIDLDGDKYSGWTIKKFADKLKQICSIITGIRVERFDDHDFKETYLDSNWNLPIDFNSDPQSIIDNVSYSQKMSVRNLLQKVGTDGIRNCVHPNTWINALFVDYVDRSSNWIITDTRFRNEVEAISKLNGITIKVYRGITDVVIDEHPSECDLNTYRFHHVLHNNSDIYSLMVEVRTLLQTLKLIK